MQDIGNLLREARESKRIKIPKAAMALKIRSQYIEALEAGDFDSVAREIYLIGYLKGYANWLGLDGEEMVSRLKRGNVDFRLEKEVSNKASSFFSVGDHVAEPGLRVLIASFVLSIMVCLLWYANKDSAIEAVSLSGELSGIENSGMVPGLAYLHGDEKGYIIMANDNVVIETIGVDGSLEQRPMEPGEISYLLFGNDSLVTADKPKMVDVFADDDSSSFVGTLADIK